MSNSEFAKRQLKKHGWKEGSGLGREQHGRADPIKVKLKIDKTGVGHDPGKEFTDHWWLRVFNETAKKIGKKDESGPTAHESEEAKAKSLKEQQRKNFYKGFIQSSTLTNGVEEKNTTSDSGSDDEKNENPVDVPTLEDIHKFCGGATGHKAARFGIRMEGKVTRASHHEKQFEEQVKKNGINRSKNVVGDELSSDFGRKKRKKMKKKKRGGDECAQMLDSDLSQTASKERKSIDTPTDNNSVNDTEEMPKKKHKKKKKNKEDDDGTEVVHVAPGQEPENLMDIAVGEATEKRKKRKKNNYDINRDLVDDSCDQTLDFEPSEKKKKKKRKKDKL